MHGEDQVQGDQHESADAAVDAPADTAPDTAVDASLDTAVDASLDTAADTATDPAPTALDLDAIQQDLADVEVALARLDAGTYWTDEVTGEPLADALLAEHPTARRA